MPAFLRGYLECDACGTVATATAQQRLRGGSEMVWDLPEGWQLYERQAYVAKVYCSYACVPRNGSMPDQVGRPKKHVPKFDERTISKVFELIESGTCGASSDDILAAIEAVLITWRRGNSA